MHSATAPEAQIVFLLLGGNLGDIKKTFEEVSLRLTDVGRLVEQSSDYRTAAWGMDPASPDFLNRVVRLETSLSPKVLMEKLLQIESAMGRSRSKVGYSNRAIDIDILFYGDRIVHEEALEIPHPRLHLRRFTLLPLSEIAPHWVHPIIKKTVAELLEACADESEVQLV